MTTELILNMVISQVGEEKAKEILTMILSMADKMTEKEIFILKKFANKGVTLITTNSEDCKIAFPNGVDKPKQYELEKILREIEI